MKFFRFLMVVLVSVFTLGFYTSSQAGFISENSNGKQSVVVKQQKRLPNTLLIKFRKKTVSSKAIDTFLELGISKNIKMNRSTKLKGHSINRWWKITKEPKQNIKKLFEKLSKHPLVESVEFDYEVSIQLAPDDTSYSLLWGLNNTGQTGGITDADIDAPEAWDGHTGENSTVLVAIIDTGVNYNHPDLVANIWTNPGEIAGNLIDDDGNGYIDDIHGYDFVNNDGDPMDDHGHGSHVSGTIAARGNNTTGVVGVSWGAKIMGVKFLNASGSGSLSGAVQAITYATVNNARITNNSWSGGGFSQALMDAISAANDADSLFVAAAGNANNNNDVSASYPASYDVPNVVAVAATDHNDAKASFSSYGLTTVDLGAPGVSILSTTLGSTYSTYSGTSMATPHVVGAAALLLSYDPTLSTSGLKNLLLATTDPVASMNGITVTGGRLNIHNALNCDRTLYSLSASQPSNNFSIERNTDAVIGVTAISCGDLISGATITATINDTDVVTLYDDGAHNDGAANDGRYANNWLFTENGAVNVRFDSNHPTYGLNSLSVSGEVVGVIGYRVSSEPYAWNDITSGTSYTLSDDSYVNIPIGFNFSFYKNTYTSVKVSSNGYLSFGPSATQYVNNPMPTASGVNDLIAPFWDDLNPASVAGRIFSKIEGTAPNRTLTVAWVGVPHFSYVGASTFEVTIFEGTNDILYQYQDVLFETSSYNNGASATVGVENSDGTVGTNYSYNAANIQNNTALRLVRVVDNIVPVANVGGPYSGYALTPITFDGSASTDAESDPLTYSWNFGDGTTGVGVAPQHTYSRRGNFTVTLVVNDGIDDSLVSTTQVNLLNRAPTASFTAPTTGDRITDVIFDASGSSDPDADTLSYLWDFGDGTLLTTSSSSIQHRYQNLGSYTITLMVRDGDLQSTPVTQDISIVNRAPVASFTAPVTGNRITDVTLDATGSTDDVAGGTLTYMWNFGDGSALNTTNSTVQHRYQTLGIFTITLSVSDGVLVSAPIAQNISIVNIAPVANAGGPYTSDVLTPITFDGSASTDAESDPLTYSWDFGDGTAGVGVSPQHTYATKGMFTVQLIVNDGINNSLASSTAVVSVLNSAPVASFTGPTTADRITDVTFDASASTDPDGDALTYTWDFGNGSTSSEINPIIQHRYQAVGNYIITLTVSDGGLISAPVTHNISIVNIAPVANAGGPYTGYLFNPVIFDGSASTDAESDLLTYSWDFGDGTSGVGVTPQHTYATKGNFTVQLTVNDGISNSVISTAQVAILNRAPVASFTAPGTGDRITELTFDASTSTDIDGDTLTYTWDFGDGTSTSTSNTIIQHRYQTLGNFTVTLTVSDGDLISAPVTHNISIVNIAPVANAGGPYTGYLFSPVTFDGSASTDADSDPIPDPLTYSWDFGDGTSGVGVAPQHTYATKGNFIVRLTVNDGISSSVVSAAVVNILNRAPAASFTGPTVGDRLTDAIFDASGSADPDSDTLSYTWNFGDGRTLNTINSTVQHRYQDLGNYTVTLTVSDGDLESVPVTRNISIENISPIANAFSDITLVQRETAILYAGLSSDPDGQIVSYQWRQISGEVTVAIQNAGTSRATFIAPNPKSFSTLTLEFEVVVTDNNGATARDTKIVYVTKN